MKTYAERLEWAMICAGMNPRTDQSELARQIPCKPQVIQYLLDHNKNAKASRYTPRIATVLHCDVNWLSDERGQAPVEQKAKEHKNGFDNSGISAGKPSLIKEIPTSFGHRIEGASGNPDDANVLHPVRDIPILTYEQASQMTAMVDPNALGEPLGRVTIHKPLSPAAFAVPIMDASMQPKFEENHDVVIIDPARGARPGKFVLARTRSGEAVFRKYRELGMNERGQMTFELTPLNNDFATLQSDRDGLEIIGAMAAYAHYEDD